MPYYVYAIHTDSNYNRLYGAFDDFREAEECEAKMRRGNHPGDNYFVWMVYAENETVALEKIKNKRRELSLPL